MSMLAALIAAMAMAFSPGISGEPEWHVLPAYQQSGWNTRCRLGNDGFAANCEANLHSGGFQYRIGIGDGQATFGVSVPGCSTDPVSYFREDLVGLPAAERRARAISAFAIVIVQLRRECRDIPAAEPQLTFIPDLAVVGEEVLDSR